MPRLRNEVVSWLAILTSQLCQMTLLGIEVHSDELELLQQAADTYDWKAMEKEVEHKFKEAALDFRDREQDSC